MGYPRWVAMHHAGYVLVGECKGGARVYDATAEFDTEAEALAWIGRQRTDAHTARTMRWRREVQGRRRGVKGK